MDLVSDATIIRQNKKVVKAFQQKRSISSLYYFFENFKPSIFQEQLLHIHHGVHELFDWLSKDAYLNTGHSIFVEALQFNFQCHQWLLCRLP